MIWIVLGTAVPMVVGLLIALLLWGVRRGSMLYRLCFFLPFVLPGVAVGIVWGWIYDPVQGLLNEAWARSAWTALQRGWLGDPSWALYAVIVTAIWGGTGFAVVIFISALRNVDVELVDASRIDGANAAGAALVHHPAADHAGVPDGADPDPGRRVQRLRHHLHHDRRRSGRCD